MQSDRHPLHAAVIQGELEAVKAEQAKGADINLLDHDATPLMEAVKRHDIEMTKHLIEAGALPICNRYGVSALHILVEKQKDTPVTEGDAFSQLFTILKNNSIDRNSDGFGQTLSILDIAILNNNESLYNFLRKKRFVSGLASDLADKSWVGVKNIIKTASAALVSQQILFEDLSDKINYLLYGKHVHTIKYDVGIETVYHVKTVLPDLGSPPPSNQISSLQALALGKLNPKKLLNKQEKEVVQHQAKLATKEHNFTSDERVAFTQNIALYLAFSTHPHDFLKTLKDVSKLSLLEFKSTLAQIKFKESSSEALTETEQAVKKFLKFSYFLKKNIARDDPTSRTNYSTVFNDAAIVNQSVWQGIYTAADVNAMINLLAAKADDAPLSISISNTKQNVQISYNKKDQCWTCISEKFGVVTKLNSKQIAAMINDIFKNGINKNHYEHNHVTFRLQLQYLTPGVDLDEQPSLWHYTSLEKTQELINRLMSDPKYIQLPYINKQITMLLNSNKKDGSELIKIAILRGDRSYFAALFKALKDNMHLEQTKILIKNTFNENTKAFALKNNEPEIAAFIEKLANPPVIKKPIPLEHQRKNMAQKLLSSKWFLLCAAAIVCAITLFAVTFVPPLGVGLALSAAILLPIPFTAAGLFVGASLMINKWIGKYREKRYEKEMKDFVDAKNKLKQESKAALKLENADNTTHKISPPLEKKMNGQPHSENSIIANNEENNIMTSADKINYSQTSDMRPKKIPEDIKKLYPVSTAQFYAAKDVKEKHENSNHLNTYTPPSKGKN